jgi:hypothetical protein
MGLGLAAEAELHEGAPGDNDGFVDNVGLVLSGT